jgi:two-component system chemotaxis sensor kinase CheA
VFQSGLSTSAIITDLSGRGLGLSIVAEKVEQLNGRITIESERGLGTTFRIFLPMSLATFRGVLAGVGEHLFIIPTLNVEKIIRVKHGDIYSMESNETIRIGDDILPCLGLGEVLGVRDRRSDQSGRSGTARSDSDLVRIIVMVAGENRMAFRVDEVIDEQQVLVKKLGRLLIRVRNISGATILGTGKIIPVLNVSDIMKSAMKIPPTAPVPGDEPAGMSGQQSILVAEDSITSRTLLKNILETAGYRVTVAVDGADAFTKAKRAEFDLIVSDVDMPRMNGFEFTTRIKNDKKLGEIPVVLVTALGSREDQERGIEAGADAYIVKSSFDQGNLLEVIKRLI